MQLVRVVRREIVVTFSLPGFHAYLEAPDAQAFLRRLHRHLFVFKVHFNVTHGNRDIEFFDAQEKVKTWVIYTYGSAASARGHCHFADLSCEHIAEAILQEFADRGCFKVEVWEDGENGAIVEGQQE